MTDQAVSDKERAESAAEIKRRSALVRQSSVLVKYGTPEELQEMVNRFKFMVPGGDKLEKDELWGLAQASFLYGLDPFMKEIFWIDGPSPGIRGLRRKGRDQLFELHGAAGIPNLDYALLLDTEKRVAQEIPEGALCYECSGMIPAKRQAWAADARVMSDAGAPWDRIEALMGDIPVTVGVGYVTVQEMNAKDTPTWWHKCTLKGANIGKWNKRPLKGFDACPDCAFESSAKPPLYSHDQQARKRAEAHFWKQECDMPFAVSPAGAGFADAAEWDELPPPLDVIDVTPSYRGVEVPDSIKTAEEMERWQEIVDADLDREPVDEVELTKNTDVLYSPADPPPAGNGSTQRPLAPEALKRRFDTTVKANKGKRKTPDLTQKVVLNLLECFDEETADDDRKAVGLYLTGKASLKDWTGAELMAALKWLAPAKHNDRWSVNALSAQEARLVRKEMLEVA